MNTPINSRIPNQSIVKALLLAVILICVGLVLWFYTNDLSMAEPAPNTNSHPLVNGQTIPEMSDGGCLGCHLSVP